MTILSFPKHETQEEEIRFWKEEYDPKTLDSLDDLVDGFLDETHHDRSAITLYLKPEESRDIKILSAKVGFSISAIIIRAAEVYQISDTEIEHFRQQADRKGAKVSSLYLTPEIRARHKKYASNLDLTGNQFYRLLINGVLRKGCSEA